MFVIVASSIFTMTHVNFIVCPFLSFLTGDISFTLLCDNAIDETLLGLEVIAHDFRFIRCFSVLKNRRTCFHSCRIGHSRGIDGTAVHIHRNHRRGQLNVLVIHFTFSIKMCIALFRKDNRIACLINDRRIQRFFFLCGICGQRVHSQRIQRQRVPMKGIGLLSSPHTFSSHTLCFGIE